MSVLGTDWKEILSISQKELKLKDKEELCEKLSWMEVDDIELNFTDLKTLFRLAQDILKFKSEQVNNLLGQIEESKKKPKRKKGRKHEESPTRNSEDLLETIQKQQELISTNKVVLEQLVKEIAELKKVKSNLDDKITAEEDSTSSRDPLSEMNELVQLQNENIMKNRHIRKLLADVKLLEEEKISLKQKASELKDKLSEATQIIENLTDQLYSMKQESFHLKELLGKTEEMKVQLSIENETLRKELSQKEIIKDDFSKQMETKLQHWKKIARLKKTEVEDLIAENARLKEANEEPESLDQKMNEKGKRKIKELQDKLSEASNEIMKSAKLIEILKIKNEHLKSSMETSSENYVVSETKNISDDGKERAVIDALKKRVKKLSAALQASEEVTSLREQELLETTTQIQMLKNENGVYSLIDELKTKKRELKFKDDEIKSLVKDINEISKNLNESQLQNEVLRQKFDLKSDFPIPTKGIMRNYQELEKQNKQLTKTLQGLENQLVKEKLDIHAKDKQLRKLKDFVSNSGLPYSEEESDENAIKKPVFSTHTLELPSKSTGFDDETYLIIEENEGLRKGLQEILNFLKDTNQVTAGVLAVQCPSLEAVLRSMDARHAAGWIAPHMNAVMELRATLGSRDALLNVLHETRKETYDVVSKLKMESQKNLELEYKLHELESQNIEKTEVAQTNISEEFDIDQFGSWVSDEEFQDMNIYDVNGIRHIMKKGHHLYEINVKTVLQYFCDKLKSLFDTSTELSVRIADEQNKWILQEEQYKAQIQNLKSQLNTNDDNSENSEGLVNMPNLNVLQRKCAYLEEAYKEMRIMKENLRNEFLDCKREALLKTFKTEVRMEKLIARVIDLTDKLRNSIPQEIFWKQNEMLNEFNNKYRKEINTQVKNRQLSNDITELCEKQRHEIIEFIQQTSGTVQNNLEPLIIQKQLNLLCIELESKNKTITTLEQRNSELQETQAKLIDTTLAAETKEEVNLLKHRLNQLNEDNKYLREKCNHVEMQLEIVLPQLQEYQQKQMNSDLEINMLRHQILDLQSCGDNKAIIARLSGEILVAHLQASENHKKIEKLTWELSKESQSRAEVENLLKIRQKIFDVYSDRYKSKLRYIFSLMDALRQQYQGSIPLCSLEKYLQTFEDNLHKNKALNENLEEVEELRSNLMIKHSVYDQILDVTKNKCFEEDDSCSHKLQSLLLEKIHSRELHEANKKNILLEQSRNNLMKQCNEMERKIILLSKGFGTSSSSIDRENKSEILPDLELEDIKSDDESTARRSGTFTLPKPQIFKHTKDTPFVETITQDNLDIPSCPAKTLTKLISVSVQTNGENIDRENKYIQTLDDKTVIDMKHHINKLESDVQRRSKELAESLILSKQRDKDILDLQTEKAATEVILVNLQESMRRKEHENETLQSSINDLMKHIENIKAFNKENKEVNEITDKENKSLLEALKQIEDDKNQLVKEYTGLLKREREDYSKSIKELQDKISIMQSQLDRKLSDSQVVDCETIKEVDDKYFLKNIELEDKCFKLQSDLDEYKKEVSTCRSDIERWKSLASERLIKMEQLNSKLEERFSQEVEQYKAENQHWMTQLNHSQRDHSDLQARLSDQKTFFVKQISEKEAHIEQLRSVVHNLKAQMMNMQTMISAHDPSFDLSAIVEVDETSDPISQAGSERLELKFDSTGELNESMEDTMKFPATSTAIWQEPIIERLRREKQFTGKQNATLRRQIKALAARERRARLEAQNLKNQIFRVSTSGSRASTAETTALHSRIASLQAQLTSARKDTQSSVALWDKWKRAQQASDRWQTRYDEKCMEIRKLESSLNLAKSAVVRLEREKRMLLARVNQVREDDKQLAIEKQERERSEKCSRCESERESDIPPVSTRALLERIQAQQRTIIALQAAEKGNEVLISEYEKALAEITVLKGQMLKLESTLLETQIHSPLKSNKENTPELQYWKSYCDMLKEENVQLTMRINSIESSDTLATRTHHSHDRERVTQLEQTVLTLRGLVSKLQSEQKSMGASKLSESRPGSGRSGAGTEKHRSQLESYRIEIANLKRTILDKDLLLEKSKEMLKIAAEREENLLRENTILRHRIQELDPPPTSGFLSA